MEIIRTNKFRLILFACTAVVFLNVLLGGQQFISDRLPKIASSAIELIVCVSESIIAFSFFRFFSCYTDKLMATLTKFIFVGKAVLVILFLFHWTEIIAFVWIEGITSFLVLVAVVIWSIGLYLKEISDDNSFKAAKLYAGFSLLSMFFSLVISFNLLQSTDVYANVVSGKTLMYYIPQLILALPYLVLFKFILTLKPDRESETGSA